MTLVVPARSAGGAIVFPHAADALAATLPLLFRLFAVAIHAGIVTIRAASHRMDVRMLESAGCAGNAGHLGVGSFAARTLHG